MKAFLLIFTALAFAVEHHMDMFQRNLNTNREITTQKTMFKDLQDLVPIVLKQKYDFVKDIFEHQAQSPAFAARTHMFAKKHQGYESIDVMRFVSDFDYFKHLGSNFVSMSQLTKGESRTLGVCLSVITGNYDRLLSGLWNDFYKKAGTNTIENKKMFKKKVHESIVQSMPVEFDADRLSEIFKICYDLLYQAMQLSSHSPSSPTYLLIKSAFGAMTDLMKDDENEFNKFQEFYQSIRAAMTQPLQQNGEDVGLETI